MDGMMISYHDMDDMIIHRMPENLQKSETNKRESNMNDHYSKKKQFVFMFSKARKCNFKNCNINNKNVRYLGINITKVYRSILEIIIQLLKDIKAALRWRGILCPVVGRINIKINANSLTMQSQYYAKINP
jgi:hypothetical protein